MQVYFWKLTYTDAIYRVDNLDRYDDRLIVGINLIDAYEQLMDFINKHTLDKFFIIGDQSISVRSKIARELVSNILVHREYTSAYPAKIIIERDRIITENWSLTKNPGRIDPNSFTPYPKNPLIAHFFVQIGRADKLGSGVRNLYKFTKIYSNNEPELIDGDVFRSIVPLGLSPMEYSENGKVSDKMSDKSEVSDKTSDKPKVSDKSHKEKLIEYMAKHGEMNAKTATNVLARSPVTARRVLSEMVSEKSILAEGANRNRTYRLVTGKSAERENPNG